MAFRWRERFVGTRRLGIQRQGTLRRLVKYFIPRECGASDFGRRQSPSCSASSDSSNRWREDHTRIARCPCLLSDQLDQMSLQAMSSSRATVYIHAGSPVVIVRPFRAISLSNECSSCKLEPRYIHVVSCFMIQLWLRHGYSLIDVEWLPCGRSPPAPSLHRLPCL